MQCHTNKLHLFLQILGLSLSISSAQTWAATNARLDITELNDFFEGNNSFVENTSPSVSVNFSGNGWTNFNSPNITRDLANITGTFITNSSTFQGANFVVYMVDSHNPRIVSDWFLANIAFPGFNTALGAYTINFTAKWVSLSDGIPYGISLPPETFINQNNQLELQAGINGIVENGQLQNLDNYFYRISYPYSAPNGLLTLDSLPNGFSVNALSSSVPEPSVTCLMSSALVGFFLLTRKRYLTQTIIA